MVAAALWASPLLAQDTAGVGRVRGQVLDNRGAALAEAGICIPALSRCVVSDPRGAFVIDDLRAGRYEIEVVRGSGRPLGATVEVRAGRDTILEFTAPDETILTETVKVTAPAFAAGEEIKSSAYLAPGADVLQAAGALQDVVRYVQTLPGAAIGTDDFRNDLVVRGGSPLENLYIVDNIDIPNINAFANFASAGGTVSVVDAQLLQDVTFLTGGYPASYGNRTSSVVQLTLRQGNRDHASSRGTVGFAGAGLVADGPIRNGRGDWIVSLRRSFLDLFTKDVGIGGVPAFYTFTAKATYDFGPRDRVWALSVGGVDRVRLGLTPDSDPADELSTLDIRYRGGRAATGLNWQRIFGTRGVGLLGVSYARSWVRSSVADILAGGPPPAGASVEQQLADAPAVFGEHSTEGEWTVKYDGTFYSGALGKVQGGASLKRTLLDYDVASPFGTDSPYFAQPGQNPIALRQVDGSFLAGAYLQSTRTIGRRVNVTVGTRFDRFGQIAAARVAPRASVQLDLTPRVSLRGSLGRYVQQPQPLFVAAFPGNRQLVPFRADHAIVGLFWTPLAGTRLSVEGYRKRYADYPVSSQIPALSLANVGDTFAVRDVLFPLTSAGLGEAAGVELFAEHRPADSRFRGAASVAWSRARFAGRDGILRPGSFDYPVVANASIWYRVTAAWELSAHGAFFSGRPYTPIAPDSSGAQRRAVYDAARINDARGPDYFRTDVQVSCLIRVKGRPVRVFAGAQNVFNRHNVAGYTWDRRHNELKTVEQLGLFPILGLEWRF